VKSALLATLFLYSGISLASPAPDEANAGASCSVLMTETECAQHRETLSGLRDPAARAAYLEQHLARLSEREIMCGRLAGYPALSRMRAQYR
jgi:hypothetical protein